MYQSSAPFPATLEANTGVDDHGLRTHLVVILRAAFCLSFSSSLQEIWSSRPVMIPAEGAYGEYSD